MLSEFEWRPNICRSNDGNHSANYCTFVFRLVICITVFIVFFVILGAVFVVLRILSIVVSSVVIVVEFCCLIVGFVFLIDNVGCRGIGSGLGQDCAFAS